VLAAPVNERSTVLARSTSAPDIGGLDVPWWPPRPTRELVADEQWTPSDWVRLGTELAVARLGSGALLVGRPALRWLPSELVRLQHLAAIAASVAMTEHSEARP
jgi:hypothetical protein